MKNWKGKRVLVIGAARQGTAISRFLTNQGAHVLLNDQKPDSELGKTIKELSALPIRFHLGGHPLSLLDDVELVCVSGGIPLTLPIIKEAIKQQIPLTNDSQIFMEAVQAPVIGITGSAGKTTTTILVGEIAKCGVEETRNVWAGGNIGNPLINHLQEIQPNDLVVLELSSFQMELMIISPEIAAILNITPNHLDRHADMKAYIAAKARILQFQREEDIAILNRDEPESWHFHAHINGKLFSFGIQPPTAGQAGTYVQDNVLYSQTEKGAQKIMSTDEIALRGPHNLQNVLAACAITLAAGFSTDAMRNGIKNIKGIPHRLELVREIRGVRWYNDSIATTPERAIAGMHSFEEPLVLLLGGRDKKLPWQSLAAEAHQRVKHIVLFGEAADLIERTLRQYEKNDFPYSLHKSPTLEEAVQKAASLVQTGDVVLLSPGGTSFDAFRDFEERGELFRKLVEEL